VEAAGPWYLDAIPVRETVSITATTVDLALLLLSSTSTTAGIEIVHSSPTMSREHSHLTSVFQRIGLLSVLEPNTIHQIKRM